MTGGTKSPKKEFTGRELVFTHNNPIKSEHAKDETPKNVVDGEEASGKTDWTSRYVSEERMNSKVLRSRERFKTREFERVTLVVLFSNNRYEGAKT